MPRVSREQTEKNRTLIEEAAARLFKSQGLNAVSVANLMAEVGLTHGGFYGHFESKDELAAVACAKAFEQSEERWARRIEHSTDSAAAFVTIVDGYLAHGRRNTMAEGCPAAALCADVAREPAGKPVRAAYIDGLRELVETLASLGKQPTDAARRADALVQMSTLVGAVVLARATHGDAISEDLLAAVKAALVPASAALASADTASPAH
jgi:TetR/AcrR family transcriptional repressor of nem operon